MTLEILWFILIAILWAGYLVLEGFDFGVGMLMPILGKKEKERRLLLNTIGPVWDGNEVWLITAGGAMFAAFPEWYATMFSGFYIPLFLILIALIVRAMGFEYRSKIEKESWKKKWDAAIVFGSWTPAILLGVAFGNLVRGVELDANFEYVGGFWALLNPFSLLAGVVTTLLFLQHGAIFISLKTDGEIRVKARALAAKFALVSTVAAAIWAVWAQIAYSDVAWTWIAVVIAAAGLLATNVANSKGREGWAFVSSAIAIVGAVVLIFGSMFPDVMPDINGINSLNIENASSTQYTLTIMTWVAVFLVPVVLMYQSWTFWVFRKRLKVENIPDPIGLPSLSVPKAELQD